MLRSFLGSIVLSCVASTAAAQVPLLNGFGGTAGYGTSCIGPNDDGSSAAIPLASAFPSGLNFFGTTQTVVHLNTNGNITFRGNLPTFTARAFPVASQPMIAPFWADVDTRSGSGGPSDGEAVIAPRCDNPAQNGIWWHIEPGRVLFTWDRVGYFRRHMDRRMSFQLVLTTPPPGDCTRPGDFDVEFRYNRCEWETGDASSGSGGFGGTQAQAGFDAGNMRDYVMIPGSRAAGISNRLCTMSNVGMPGIWRFQIRAGVVLCPDAGMMCTVPGAIGACAEGRLNCVGAGTECVQQVRPAAERCDNLDNDCNGTVDDGSDVCPPAQACVRGMCVPRCFEGGCYPDQTCTADGCVETACATVTCPSGQRCSAGRCVGACDDVTCPVGRSCRSGRCVDTCEGVTCDECNVCDTGSCVPRCSATSCPAGLACGPSGRCVPSACASVSCGPGTYCRDGACVDACADAVCPAGEMCREGACVPMDRPDANIEWPDAPFIAPDAGVPGWIDAGGGDAGRRRRMDPGCGCRVGARQFPAGLGFLGFAALLALRTRRRR